MPTGPEGQKRPAHVTGNPVHIMRIATGELAEGAPPDGRKDPAAVSMKAADVPARKRGPYRQAAPATSN